MESDPRDDFLAEVVAGKSFADVGGLWGVVNERVSVANRLDAASLAMIDATPADQALWQQFRTRMADLGVSGAREISSDVCQLEGERFDVVHCSGVLYHHPDPFVLIRSLRALTAEHLVLTSAISQERIENEHGVYTLPPSGAILVPALDAAERSILGHHWSLAGAQIDGIHREVAYSLDDFGPWWWLPTRGAMLAMCQAAGLRVLASADSWNGNAQTLLLDTRASQDG